MAPGLNQCIVYVGSTDQSMLNRMATDNTAKSLSCSWSWKPADPQVDDPIFHADGRPRANLRQCFRRQRELGRR